MADLRSDGPFRDQAVGARVIGVSIQDGPSSQVTVGLPLSPPAGWIEDQRARLMKARQVPLLSTRRALLVVRSSAGRIRPVLVSFHSSYGYYAMATTS